MRLQDKTKIEVSGFEVATALGCLRYIYDYKRLDLGNDATNYLINLIKKLEEARDKELK